MFFIDYGMSLIYFCYMLLGKNSVVGIESVVNFDNVLESGSMIYILVLNIVDGSGGFVCVFVIYDDEFNKINVVVMVICFMFFLYLLVVVFVCNVL